MLHILIPTDFSPCAESALRYGLEWASNSPSTIHLYHRILDKPDSWSLVTDNLQDPELTATPVAERIQFWGSKFAQANIPFRITLSGGSIVDNVERYIRDNPVDVVFMGTRGHKKKEGEQLGSNALALLSAVKLPFLVAKEEVDKVFDMSEIVFASSFDKQAKLAFPFILDFVRPFMPEVHLLNIEVPRFISSTKFITVSAMNDFKELATGFKAVSHFHKDSHIGRGIIAFCDNLGADLIAFSESSRSVFRGTKIADEVKYLIENASQPVYFVHDIASDYDKNV